MVSGVALPKKCTKTLLKLNYNVVRFLINANIHYMPHTEEWY